MGVKNVGNDSLLNYLMDSGRGSSIDSLDISTSLPGETGAANADTLAKLKELLAKKTSAGTGTDKSYQLLKSSAQDVRTAADKLLEGGSNSLFAKAEASGDNTELLKSIKAFVKDYNTMLSDLKKCSDIKSAAQYEKFAEMAVKKVEQFKKAGITVGEDGSLSIDEDALGEAKVSDLKSLFNGASSFTSRVKANCVYVESNASANERILSTDTYGKSGKYSNYLSGLSSTYNRKS